MNNPGWAVWITGLPASGKSTVAQELKTRLDEMGIGVQILESETMRRVLVPNPTSSPEEQDAFHSSLAYIGVLLTKNGVNVIFDATASKRRWRRAARGLIDDFLLVYIRCPIDVCRERDIKGVYREAEAEGKKYFIDAYEVYEEPWDPDIELDCVKDPPKASAEKIIEAMKENDFI